jgi:hypothetical protein
MNLKYYFCLYLKSEKLLSVNSITHSHYPNLGFNSIKIKGDTSLPGHVLLIKKSWEGG